MLIGAGIIIGSFIFIFLNNRGIRYSHTIKIDGINDFYDYENFTTTSTGYYGYIAWDQDYIYIGMSGDDLASGNEDPLKWIFIYIGNGSTGIGTTLGHPYTNQQPNLPFMATHHIRWNTASTDLTAFEWTGSWTNASWDFTDDAFHNATTQFFEMRVPIADIGSPTTVSVHINMINENNPGEWTYAGVPSTSFTDGFNPDYSKYFQFDLYGTSVPIGYAPI